MFSHSERRLPLRPSEVIHFLLRPMSLAEFNSATSALSMAAEACLLVRLLWMGAARRYSCFFAYFLADIVQSLLLIGIPTYSSRYGYIYLGGQAVKTVFAICASVQLWLLALREYLGLAQLGRKVAMWMMGVALFLAAAGLSLQPPLSAYQSVFLHYFNAFEGALDSMVVLFLLSATVFLLWFPVQVPRNVALLAGGFVFRLTQWWAGLLLVNQYPKAAHSVSAAVLILELACVIFWVATLRRSGEDVTTITGHRWNPAEAERLMNQLDAINNRLERA